MGRKRQPLNAAQPVPPPPPSEYERGALAALALFDGAYNALRDELREAERSIGNVRGAAGSAFSFQLGAILAALSQLDGSYNASVVKHLREVSRERS